MGFAFGLQSYLDIKKKLEKQKETEYAGAVERLNGAIAVLNGITGRIDGGILKMKSEVGGVFSPYEIRARRIYIKGLENQAQEQKKLIERLRVEAEEKRLELTEAVKDRKALEKLREKAVEEYRIEENRKEQKTVDEIVSYRNGI